MRSILTIITLLALSSTTFAHGGKKPHKLNKKMAKVVIKGKKAMALYEALEADIETKDRPKFTADVKKVASLRCAKLISKEDTSVEKYRCTMKGKKMRKGPKKGPKAPQKTENN